MILWTLAIGIQMQSPLSCQPCWWQTINHIPKVKLFQVLWQILRRSDKEKKQLNLMCFTDVK